MATKAERTGDGDRGAGIDIVAERAAGHENVREKARWATLKSRAKERLTFFSMDVQYGLDCKMDV